MKLIIDMNLSPRWAKRLEDAGFIAAHWSSIGNPGASDTEILSYAAKTDSIVLTQDLDFGAILAATQGEGPSVLQIRSEDVSPEHIGTQVIMALKQMQVELEHGALLTIEPKQTRMRVLPLRPKGK
jgi:predicted nuclease of predicted toxin-antitoxin system